MEQNPNESNKVKPAASTTGVRPVTVVTDQNLIRDPSVMLNGGNPIQIGFNTTISFNAINKETYKATTAKADPKVFPAGLRGLPDSFLGFATKIEPALFKWLATKENLAQFTAQPVVAIQKFCADQKLQLPDDIKAFLIQTQKANAAIKYNMPGVKFKNVTSSINPQKK